jgi:UPF0176 protein
MKILNISAYKFVHLENLPELKYELLHTCKSLGLKGTILLGQEGINLMLAGEPAAIAACKIYLASNPQFTNLPYKESYTEQPPFERMVVKVKKEIVTMGVGQVPVQEDVRYAISPQELKQWLDEGRDFTLLDVRNHYEVQCGTFSKAVTLGINAFRDFPQAVTSTSQLKDPKPMVMFCTGGIRCEKALPWMQQQGYTDVYQLDGGILTYLKECGDAHFQGNCFVFDDRIAVDVNLEKCQ